MACVLRWSFSVVGAGSSERAWPRLVCWLLILITAGSSEPGAPSPGVAAGFAFARISHWPASAGPRAEGSTEAPASPYSPLCCSCADNDRLSQTRWRSPIAKSSMGRKDDADDAVEARGGPLRLMIEMGKSFRSDEWQFLRCVA